MSFSSGDRLGPYEIVARLGAGGMGEVYRARDPKLGREIAIKVLAGSVANDEERLGRFRREAQLLAALNHPNIAAIYGLEEAPATSSGHPSTGSGQGVVFLVLELVEGEDLAQRLARGSIPIHETIAIAKQIVEALEEAHDKGIVHRDLKPANIKVRPDGRVKVLDFGLAKATAGDAPSSAPSLADSPTLTRQATEAGVILGTAAYMSPEQARGKPVDRRTDIWAFGALLFEMLTGKQLFDGETLSDTLAAVLREEIEWTALPPQTPEPVRRLLARCLDRDARQRLQAIGEARVALDEATTPAHASGAPVTAPATSSMSGRGLPAASASPAGSTFTSRWRWPAVVGLAAVVLTVAFGLWRREHPTADRTTTKAQGDRSIAVLPFTNSGGNADDGYLADGMADELIAALGKVPGLHVAARSSAFAFKGQSIDVREVAKRLGVTTVLEGSIRRSGQRLRVTASLVSASDGLQLWSDTFQSEGGDPFAVQDAVTRGVVTGLALQLGGNALAASQAGRTKDPEAHDLYLRGLSYAKPESEADLRKGLELHQQALARDPNFALPYTAIGWTYVMLADAYMPGNEAYPRAKAAAQAAIARDPLVADAHAVLGYSLSAYDWDPVAAERELRRALELDPNSAYTEFLYGTYLCAVARTEEGLAHLDHSSRLDPLSALPVFTRGMCLYWDHRYEESIAAHRKTQELAPGFWYVDSYDGASYRELGDFEAAVRAYEVTGKTLDGVPQFGLAITYARMGRTKEARDILRQLEDWAKTHYVPLVMLAGVHASLGDMDAAVASLQRALDTRETLFPIAHRLPELAPVRDDPRVARLLKQVAPLPQAKP